MSRWMTGGVAAVGEGEHERVDLDLALLEVPVRPHRLARRPLSGRRVNVDVVGSSSIAQKCFAHGPGARTTCSPTSMVPWLVTTARPSRRGRTRSLDLDAGEDPHALGSALAGEPIDRVDVEGEPTLVLVEADGDTLRPPVGKQRLHVRVDLLLADDERRAVADPLLPLERLDQVVLLTDAPSAM